MIKFKALIHKETRTVIQYEDWKKKAENNDVFIIRVSDAGHYEYKSLNMLVSTHFVIVYDSEFTTEELYKLYGLSGDLSDKMRNLINERNILKSNLNIEV